MKTTRYGFLIAAILLFALPLRADEAPKIVRGTLIYSDVIQYPLRPGASLEAWEVRTDWIDGVYMNYSRAPWGDPTIRGLATQVCYVKGKDKKVIGISENADRLLPAMIAVLEDQVGHVRNKFVRCESYKQLLAVDPAWSDLKTFAASF